MNRLQVPKLLGMWLQVDVFTWENSLVFQVSILGAGCLKLFGESWGLRSAASGIGRNHSHGIFWNSRVGFLFVLIKRVESCVKHWLVGCLQCERLEPAGTGKSYLSQLYAQALRTEGPTYAKHKVVGTQQQQDGT